MKVLIFGATGMVGQGVLLECERDPGVTSIVALGRTPVAAAHPKLTNLIHADLANYDGLDAQLTGFDACFFSLGVTSNGMSEADYTRVTYTWTVAAGESLSRLNPGMTFIYVSGSGTDSTEKGRSMWARVKGRTENALLRLPLSAYMFRPGFIQPMDGIESKTPSYRIFYKVLAPLMPLLRRALPSQVLTTREIGQAMLSVTRHGYEKRILETRDLRAVVSR
jgi:uncharacterized protein YbjT (DUF2867 family)